MVQKDNSKRNDGKNKNIASKDIPSKNKSEIIENLSFIERLDNYFEKNLKVVLWVSLSLTFLFSLLLFDPRVSLTGDDSGYIIRAGNFIKKFIYPSFQGPLYPIVLSPFILLFGINLVLLKSLSVIFMMGSVFFTYKAFFKRIPALILTVTLILLSINSYILYYSSQTYSEAFFMFVQALSFYIIFKYLIDKIDNPATLSEILKSHLLTALCILLLVLTRNVGLAALFALLVYLILLRKWKHIFLALGAFVLVFALFQLIKYSLWGDANLNFESQGSTLSYKNAYNPSEGKEDLPGYFNRLVVNSNLYISKNFYVILGLRPDDFTIDVAPPLTVITYLLFIVGIFLVFKKNNYVLFTGIYAGTICLTTFTVLQTMWDQSRLITPYVPLIILFLFSTFYYFLKKRKLSLPKTLLIAFPLVLFTASLSRTTHHVREAQKINGIYSGLTPDWENYVKISKWSSKNIPPDKVIACRKPSISFIYGNGRKFFGIERIPTYSGDTIFKDWKKNENKYVAINYLSLSSKLLPLELHHLIINSLDAIVFYDTIQYFLYKIPDSESEYFHAQLKNLRLQYISSCDTFVKAITSDKAYSVYMPDSLFTILKRNKVEYVIRASLRKYPEKKTNYIINTVERYVYFVQSKYPDLFSEVAQMGDDEPATLSKINYEKYGVRIDQVQK